MDDGKRETLELRQQLMDLMTGLESRDSLQSRDTELMDDEDDWLWTAPDVNGVVPEIKEKDVPDWKAEADHWVRDSNVTDNWDYNATIGERKRETDYNMVFKVKKSPANSIPRSPLSPNTTSENNSVDTSNLIPSVDNIASKLNSVSLNGPERPPSFITQLPLPPDPVTLQPLPVHSSAAFAPTSTSPTPTNPNSPPSTSPSVSPSLKPLPQLGGVTIPQRHMSLLYDNRVDLSKFAVSNPTPTNFAGLALANGGGPSIRKAGLTDRTIPISSTAQSPALSNPNMVPSTSVSAANVQTAIRSPQFERAFSSSPPPPLPLKSDMRVSHIPGSAKVTSSPKPPVLPSVAELLKSSTPANANRNTFTSAPTSSYSFPLVSLLRSNLPLSFFLAMLLTKQSAELLFFILDVHAFELTEFKPTSEPTMEQTARRIYKTYIVQDSLFEIEVTDEARENTYESIILLLQLFQAKRNGDKELDDLNIYDLDRRFIFMQPIVEALGKLDNFYDEFLKGPYFERMQIAIAADEPDEWVRETFVKVLDQYYGPQQFGSGKKKNGAPMRERVKAFLQNRFGIVLMFGPNHVIDLLVSSHTSSRDSIVH